MSLYLVPIREAQSLLRLIYTREIMTQNMPENMEWMGFECAETAKIFIFLGRAFDLITCTSDANVLILGTCRGKFSGERLAPCGTIEIDKAA
jgi:hypothetical protein